MAFDPWTTPAHCRARSRRLHRERGGLGSAKQPLAKTKNRRPPGMAVPSGNGGSWAAT
jgi:hypothetical protein